MVLNDHDQCSAQLFLFTLMETWMFEPELVIVQQGWKYNLSVQQVHATFFPFMSFHLDSFLVLLAHLFLLFYFSLLSLPLFLSPPLSLSAGSVADCWLLAALRSISNQLWYLTRLILSLLVTLFHHPLWKLSQIAQALCKYLMRFFRDQASNHHPHLLLHHITCQTISKLFIPWCGDLQNKQTLLWNKSTFIHLASENITGAENAAPLQQLTSCFCGVTVSSEGKVNTVSTNVCFLQLLSQKQRGVSLEEEKKKHLTWSNFTCFILSIYWHYDLTIKMILSLVSADGWSISASLPSLRFPQIELYALLQVRAIWTAKPWTVCLNLLKG